MFWGSMSFMSAWLAYPICKGIGWVTKARQEVDKKHDSKKHVRKQTLKLHLIICMTFNFCEPYLGPMRPTQPQRAAVWQLLSTATQHQEGRCLKHKATRLVPSLWHQISFMYWSTSLRRGWRQTGQAGGSRFHRHAHRPNDHGMTRDWWSWQDWSQWKLSCKLIFYLVIIKLNNCANHLFLASKLQILPTWCCDERTLYCLLIRDHSIHYKHHIKVEHACKSISNLLQCWKLAALYDQCTLATFELRFHILQLARQLLNSDDRNDDTKPLCV